MSDSLFEKNIVPDMSWEEFLAAKKYVSALSDFSSNLGKITAGTITMPADGYIKGGQTDYHTGTGFFLGYSGAAYKFSVGNTNNYLNYDGTNLKLYSNLADGIILDYGSNQLLKEGGSIKFTSVTAPTACTATLVTTDVGNVDAGEHIYKVTFISATGETELGTASNSVTTDATHKQVALSAIPVSTSGAVTSRKIYRTKVGESTEYFILTTIADNTTTTYTDNTADASLTGEDARLKENDSFGKILIDGIESLGLGGRNTFVGQNSGRVNATGDLNSTLGKDAFYSNAGGGWNTAIGASALYSNIYGHFNSAVGKDALYSNTGHNNSALGLSALYANSSGYQNSAVGRNALVANTTGYYNTAIGAYAGNKITTGNSNSFLGHSAGSNASQKIDAVNSMALGALAYTTKSNQVVLGNTSVVETLLNGNVKIAGTVSRATTEGTNHLDIFDGTAPVGTLANGISLYSTTGELRVMDAAGNATLLSPHDKKTNEWIFESVNTVTGKRVRIDMEKMMRKLNDKFGWDFIHDILE